MPNIKSTLQAQLRPQICMKVLVGTSLGAIPAAPPSAEETGSGLGVKSSS